MAIKVGVLGATGRMGRMVSAVLDADAQGTRVVGRVASRADKAQGVTEDLLGVCDAADVVIDFTLPAAFDANLDAAVTGKAAFVVGTTGLSAAQDAALDVAARQIPVLHAANFSLGVNLLLDLVCQAAHGLPGVDIEVLEMHHNAKRDAPSGTALALGRAAAAGRGWDFDQVAKLSREGEAGARHHNEIGFATLRGGGVVGDHSVILAGARETLTFSHHAADRALFAEGAVAAAKWLPMQTPGRYGMSDLLGL